jgi:hypothetical protein
MLTAKRLLALTLLSASLSLSAVPPAISARPVLTGEVAEERVKELTTAIDWQDNLREAEAQAQKSGKLIFWMHMLGHIDGAT